MTTALVLRTCKADGSSHSEFRWPLTVGAEVVAPDWDATPECGRGLHGALHGEGDGDLFNWSPDAAWLVVEVVLADVVDLNGKVKFPRCIVRHVGDQRSATNYIMETDPLAGAVIGATTTAGDYGQATAGYGGQATAGYGGHATAGDYGQATAGYDGHATAGNRGIIQLKWHDGTRSRIAVGYVGEGGIEANVAYRCDDAGNLVRA